MNRAYLETYDGGKTFSAMWLFEDSLRDEDGYFEFLLNVLKNGNATMIQYEDYHDFGNWDIAQHSFKSASEFEKHCNKTGEKELGSIDAVINLSGSSVSCSVSGPNKYSCARVTADGDEKGLTELEKLIIKYAK